MKAHHALLHANFQPSQNDENDENARRRLASTRRAMLKIEKEIDKIERHLVRNSRKVPTPRNVLARQLVGMSRRP